MNKPLDMQKMLAERLDAKLDDAQNHHPEHSDHSGHTDGRTVQALKTQVSSLEEHAAKEKAALKEKALKQEALAQQNKLAQQSNFPPQNGATLQNGASQQISSGRTIHPVLIAIVMFAIAGVIAFSQDFGI